MPISMSAAQIADDIADRIAAGEYRPGTALPTYRELAVLYSVGRTTVSVVILMLKERGLVVGEPGRGVFVAD